MSTKIARRRIVLASMALAEYDAKIRQAQRRRTLRFVATAGHHAGSPNSKWLHDHRDTALAKTALMMNLEHVGAVDAFIFRDAKLRANQFSAHRYYFNRSNRLREIVFGTFYKYGFATFPDLQDGQGEMNWAKRPPIIATTESCRKLSQIEIRAFRVMRRIRVVQSEHRF